MKVLARLKIRQKLQAITMLTVAVALSLASVALTGYEFFNLRHTMERESKMLAEMIGQNSTAALTFEDYRSAQELLQSLRAHPSVVTGAIYTPQGMVAAHRGHLTIMNPIAEVTVAAPTHQASPLEAGHH